MNEKLQREIDAYLEAHWNEIVADIDALVRIESVEDLAAAAESAPFGPGPRKALDQALAIASRLGFNSHDCAGHIGYADLEGASPTQVGIIGHVDVVPAGVGWNFEPFAVTRQDGYLVGRGVVDDKGPLVVALHAARLVGSLAKGEGRVLPYTVRVIFGVNEETEMADVAYYGAHFNDPAFLFTPDNQFPLGYGEAGIAHGVLSSKQFADGDILCFEAGEAPNAVPGQAMAHVRLGGKTLSADGKRVSVELDDDGSAWIHVTGTAAHASTPELGENAIDMLVDFLAENGVGTPDEKAFLALMQKLHGKTDGSGLGINCADEHFGPLSAAGSVVRLEDGHLRQTIDFRYPTTTSAERIVSCISKLAAEVDATFSMGHDKPPFLMSPDSPAVRALLDSYREVTGDNRQPSTSKGGTYAREFSNAVSFGPEKPWEESPAWAGGMHGPDEAVSEALLKQAFAVYAHALDSLMMVDL